MRGTVVLLALVLLTACADPKIVYREVPVEVPVAVPCRAPAVAVPEWQQVRVTKSSTLFEKVKRVLVELELRKSYEAQLLAANHACQ